MRSRRLFAIAIGVFATLGVLYTVFFIYATVFLPHCMLGRAEQAVSPNEEYFATFEQTICEDAGRSRSQVMIGRRGRKERIVAAQVKGTNEVGLTWSTDSSLVVSYPAGASVEKLGPYDEGWPGVTLLPRDRH
jgi:hypothetical protein